jgi:hypothetical protein
MYLVNKANKVTSEPFFIVAGISIRAGFYLPAGPGFTKHYVGNDFGPTALGHSLTIYMIKSRVYGIHPGWVFVDGAPTRGDMEYL